MVEAGNDACGEFSAWSAGEDPCVGWDHISTQLTEKYHIANRHLQFVAISLGANDKTVTRTSLTGRIIGGIA